MNQQLIISGVGGQGILFVTRLLADTAIDLGLPVLTSETHGMAQRGGIVISHLKVGEFSSPLVRPGQADGLLAMKPENIALHRHFLRPEGWIAANAPEAPANENHSCAIIDADKLALELGNPQSVNLLLLGLALAALPKESPLFCSVVDIRRVMTAKLEKKGAMLEQSLKALDAGIHVGTSAR